MSERACGECGVCCVVAEVRGDGFLSPAFETCPHLVDGEHRCGIFGSEDRPPVCGAFSCSWLRGVGPDDARPDKVGAMLSINRTAKGVIGFCIEMEENAVMTTAREMVVTFARLFPMPLVVSDYGKRPPHDTGDRVVIHEDLVNRAAAMLGDYRGRLASDVSIFDLKKRTDG